MANYYTHIYEDFLAHTDEIYDFLSGEYMEGFNGRWMSYENDYDVLSNMRYVEIASYRKLQNDDRNISEIKRAVLDTLSSYHNIGAAVAYIIVSIDGMQKIYLASEATPGIDNALRNALPSMNCMNKFITDIDRRRISRCSGIVTGKVSIENDIVDSIMNVMQDMDSMVCILARPVENVKMRHIQNSIYELLNLSQSFLNINNTFGSGSRIEIRNDFPGNSRLANYLENLKEYYDNLVGGLWESVVWFTASNVTDAQKLGATLAGCLKSEDTLGLENVKYFFIDRNEFARNRMIIPQARYAIPTYNMDQSLLKGSLVSYVSGNDLASLFQLPLYSHRGLEVIDTNVSLDSKHDFRYNMDPVREGAQSFELGIMSNSKQPYRVEFNSLLRHVLVTGATGGGKTNTVMSILENVYRNSKTFCVIEPAKKDYWKMMNVVDDLYVFSSGYDARTLLINPLEPEDGVKIGNHIDELMYAFSGAFDLEKRIGIEFKGLLTYTYKKFNWLCSDIAIKNRQKYPTIKDVLNNLDEYSDNYIRSGREVKQDIEGALSARLNDLMNTGCLDSTGRDKQITGEFLCNHCCVIELDDLSLEMKPFVANILLIQINEYIRKQNGSRSLKSVLVLEEAHNIISNILPGTEINSKALASQYFTSMLTELREYGIGIVIADQSPSKLNMEAVNTTGTKIIHATASEKDVDMVAYHLRLNEYQRGLLSMLGCGQAVISSLGNEIAAQVDVGQRCQDKIMNLAYLYCEKGLFGRDERIERIVPLDINTRMFIEKVMMNRYDRNVVTRMVDEFLGRYNLNVHDRLCALGYIVTNYNSNNYGMREKRIVLYAYAIGSGVI